MFLEVFMVKKIFNRNENFVSSNEKPNYFLNFFATILQLLVLGIAGYLSWNCNKNSNIALRILYVILSVLFSGLYILWYVIYHIAMKVPC